MQNRSKWEVVLLLKRKPPWRIWLCFQVSFDRINKAEDGTETVKHVKRMLYHRMNVVPQKKVMTFNRHMGDFEFHASYTELDFLSEEEKR